MAARGFSAAAVMKKGKREKKKRWTETDLWIDVLQDLFLKELKAYKPQPVAASEESAAKDLKLPPAPAVSWIRKRDEKDVNDRQVPEIEGDISQQLAAYDAEPEEIAH